MTFSDRVRRAGLEKVYEFLDKDPDQNIPKIVEWLERLDRNGGVAHQLPAIKKYALDPESNWYKLARSLWDDIDDEVRETLFTNFVVNGNILTNPRLAENRARHQCNIPWAILLDPTSACDLHCTGCQTPRFGDGMNLSFDELDSIVEQGKELGTCFYAFAGGDPLLRKDDIIALCNKHSECEFLAFTNGTLIDEEFAREMLRVKNFIPAISVEGFEEETDSRRGKGTFARLRAAMEILRRNKLPFGVSCRYTSKNCQTVGSEKYIDAVIEWGAKFAWFFNYMPVGSAAASELMVTAEQREEMYRRIREFRKTKPLLTLDLQNDGENVGGCIAGGRYYCHINANGDVEPCAFIHYSDSNIHSKTLLAAYQSPLFMAYRSGQPFNPNLLRPCPLLDNPDCLSGMVDASGAVSTDREYPEDVHTLCGKCRELAADWAVTADRLWTEAGKA